MSEERGRQRSNWFGRYAAEAGRKADPSPTDTTPTSTTAAPVGVRFLSARDDKKENLRRQLFRRGEMMLLAADAPVVLLGHLEQLKAAIGGEEVATVAQRLE